MSLITSPTITSNPVLDELAPTLAKRMEMFKQRHFLWPPEMLEWPCDLHEGWVWEVIDIYTALFTKFVETATTQDFERLLVAVFTDSNWRANRRAFFKVLHDYAQKCEKEGKTVSADLVSFYRARYNPPYRFKTEQ